MLESLLIRYIDAIVVVSDSIAKWYQMKYKIRKVYVVRNFPYRLISEALNSPVLRSKYNIVDGEIIYIYHGAVGNGRGIEIILNAFAKCDNRKHIIMMGYGELESLINEYTNKYDNIHFHAAVKPQEVINYLSDADVGLSLIENTCESYYYSLPNKMFEYLASGLPVITSDFPEMSKIIDEDNCGWKIQPEEGFLIELIENISVDDILEKKVNVKKCKDKFTWENEEKTLFEVYGDLFQNQS